MRTSAKSITNAATAVAWSRTNRMTAPAETAYAAAITAESFQRNTQAIGSQSPPNAKYISIGWHEEPTALR
jgi:hypothetical protein